MRQQFFRIFGLRLKLLSLGKKLNIFSNSRELISNMAITFFKFHSKNIQMRNLQFQMLSSFFQMKLWIFSNFFRFSLKNIQTRHFPGFKYSNSFLILSQKFLNENLRVLISNVAIVFLNLISKIPKLGIFGPKFIFPFFCGIISILKNSRW